MERLLSPREASEATGLSVNCLRELSDRGCFPSVRCTPCGKHRKYRLSLIEAYIQSCLQADSPSNGNILPIESLPEEEPLTPGSLEGFPILQSLKLEEKRAKHKAALAKKKQA